MSPSPALPGALAVPDLSSGFFLNEWAKLVPAEVQKYLGHTVARGVHRPGTKIQQAIFS